MRIWSSPLPGSIQGHPLVLLLPCQRRPVFQQGRGGGQDQGKQSPKFGLEGEPGGQAPPPTPAPAQRIPLPTHPCLNSLVPNLRMPGMAPWAGATSVLAFCPPQPAPPPPPCTLWQNCLSWEGTRKEIRLTERSLPHTCIVTITSL